MKMMWISFESQDIYDSVYYGYLYCKLLGLWPSSWKPRGKHNHLIGISILTFWFVITTYFLYDNITDTGYWDLFHETTNCYVLTWGTRTEIVASLILGILIVIRSFVHVAIRKDRFFAMFDTIVYVDKILENEFYYDMQLTFLARLLFFSTLFITISVCTFTVITYLVFEYLLELGNLKIYSSFLMANLPFVTSIISYLVFTVNIRMRFIYINTIFEQMTLKHVENIIVKDVPNEIPTVSKSVSDKKRKVLTWTDKRSLWTKLLDFFSAKSLVNQYKITKATPMMEVKESINHLIHLHSKLCDCVDQVNDVFSIKLLISVGYMFVFIVFACFTGYRVMYQSHEKGDIVAITHISWMCYYICLLLSITTTSSLACCAAKYTGRVVHRVINKTWDPIIINRLRLASQQLLMRKPAFTCHFFTFDLTLLYAIISANATYLVFLISLDVKAMNNINSTIVNTSLTCIV